MNSSPDAKPESEIAQKPKYQYFLDRNKIEVESPSLTGAEVRAHLSPDKAGYAIFLEAQGNEPDKLVNDGDTFSLEKKPIRFYSVPPANFGAQ
ncbi:MAG: hypothetical protein JWN25_3009 [Verrucomicrobiales bacterium]|nr:hypothetical protein [Verrucomicrobiales bacterium]